jgi:hypothetical protein
VYEPYGAASIGEYGLDIDNGTIANPNGAQDFMSYCAPVWISIFTHQFLVNAPGLVPQLVPTGAGGAPDRMLTAEPNPFERRADRLEPFVHMLGVIDPEGKIDVTSVMRLDTRYLVKGGVPTRYVAQLIDEKGEVVAEDPVFAFPSDGAGGDERCAGCGAERDDETLVFKAMIRNIARGAELLIVRDGEVAWRRQRPSEPVELREVKADLGREGELNLSWDLKARGDVEICARWSADDGRTWGALAVGLDGDGAQVATDHLPGGELRFEIMVSDGFDTVTAVTDSVRVPRRAPVPTILYPVADRKIVVGRQLHLRGAVASRAGVAPGDVECRWSIDEKEVGRGLDIWVDAPRPGRHAVRLDAHDVGGSATEVVMIEIPNRSKRA